jgi:hypothetical protein
MRIAELCGQSLNSLVHVLAVTQHPSRGIDGCGWSGISNYIEFSSLFFLKSLKHDHVRRAERIIPRQREWTGYRCSCRAMHSFEPRIHSRRGGGRRETTNTRDVSREVTQTGAREKNMTYYVMELNVRLGSQTGLAREGSLEFTTQHLHICLPRVQHLEGPSKHGSRDVDS